MKNTQQGFIGIVLVIVAALAIGRGVYYQHKQKEVRKAELRTDTVIDLKEETDQDQKTTPSEKPVVVSFEAKARTAAQASECSKWGTIGATTKIDVSNEYAIFAISNSLIPTTRHTCVVDFYAGTVEAPLVITPENIAGPRKIESASIKEARSLANKGDCAKKGIITSFNGYISMYGGGKSTVFRVSSFEGKTEIGMCTVDVNRNTSQFITPVG